MLFRLAEWYIKHKDEFYKDYQHPLQKDISFNRALIDYLAGMTDDFAIRKFQEIFIPQFYSLPERKTGNTENHV